jgi:radical SAM-linked protein
MNMIIRSKFNKTSFLKYISHLDLMNTLRRAFRRGQIPITFSQGFNPHPRLSLAQPLPVGMEGRGEYFDLELNKKMSLDDFNNIVNLFLPEGIKILESREIPQGTDSLQSVINTGVYLIKMDIDDNNEYEKEINKFINQKELIIIRKRNKKKDRQIDIKPLVYSIEIIEDNLWRFILSTGSRGNIRPEEVLIGLSQISGIREVPIINVVREGLYVRISENLFEAFAPEVVGEKL